MSRKTIAAVILALAAAPVVAGCHPGVDGTPAGCPSPAFQSGSACVFTPAPTCPPGWHPNGPGCLVTGTLQPGQNLPLPTMRVTPVPWPGKAPAGSLAVRATPAESEVPS